MKGDLDMQRNVKSRAELGRLCASVLRPKLGMRELRDVRIVPYTGMYGWTCDIGSLPAVTSQYALQDAIEAVRGLQRKYALA
jgi:hypothetical protein